MENFWTGTWMDFWTKLIAQLIVTNKYYDVQDSFEKLKTDRDRVIYIFNIMWENNCIPHAISMPKDAEISEKLRKEGNEIYVKCNSSSTLCHLALKFYTKSIASAPDTSRQLALAYANRSAILFELSLYSDCIQDIDRALNLNYPDDLKGKLYLRKTECLIILGDRTAKNMIKKARYWINKMTQSSNKLQTKLDILRQKTEQKNTQNNLVKLEKSENYPLLPVIKSRNKEVLCASDAAALKYDKHNGRHVVATRNIDAGEVLVVEKPYSLLLAQENISTYCSNCLKVCWATIPCKYCIYAMYCSEECRDIEWRKCHDVECAVFAIMINCGLNDNDLLSVRLVVLAVKEAGGIQKLRTMLEEVEKSNDPKIMMGFSSDGKFHSNKYTSLYTLKRNTDKRPFENLFKTAVNTCFILYLLTQHTKFFGTKLSCDLKVLATNENVTFLGGLILRHQQILSTNAHSFTEMQDSKTVVRGSAIMPFCSLFNHSCSSNIFRVSTSQHMVLYAVCPIRKGEQVLDSYRYSHSAMPKVKRQEYLREHYYFTCSCVACEEDWPLFNDLKSFKTLVKTARDKDLINEALQKLNMYIDLVKTDDVLDKPYIIEDLLMMIRVLYDRVPFACQELIAIVETLRRVYELHGNKVVLPAIEKTLNKYNA